jgi:hypothetical protein
MFILLFIIYYINFIIKLYNFGILFLFLTCIYKFYNIYILLLLLLYNFCNFYFINLE